MLVKRILLHIRKDILDIIKRPFIKKRNSMVLNKDISIISNNCIGANISGKLGLRYNSPTVNLQILPSQYVKFITNLTYYLQREVNELITFSEDQEDLICELYGKKPYDLNFPFGIIDNEIIICFQHFKSFEKAKIDWDRRKKRVDKTAFVYIAEASAFESSIKAFYEVELPNKLLFVLSYDGQYPQYVNDLVTTDSTTVIGVKCAQNHHFMDEYKFMTSYYEENFNSVEWINSLEV